MKLKEDIKKEKERAWPSLYKLCQKVPERTRRHLLAIIGIIILCICIMMVVRPDDGSANIELVPYTHITPSLVPQPSDEAIPSTGDYGMLLEFIHTMDSLRLHDRATYDKILKGHEGLLDSVHLVIRLYQETLH
jgi:hypothetical protein